MKNILFIHQSADLYGSDKTLLYLVKSIKDIANPIVVLPEEGLLTEELKKSNIEYFIIPVIKVSRQLFLSFDAVKMPFIIFSALRTLKKKLANRTIDIVHSNTLAVFLGAIYSKRYGIDHIWHIHEIIKHPKIVANSYPFLVDWFSDFVVFNSYASAEHLYLVKPNLKSKSKVIHNGLNREVAFSTIEEQTILRQSLFKTIDNSSTIIGLVGRINKHKGHRLLLNTFEELIKSGTNNIYLLFIGSTIKSQKYLLEELKNEIKIKNLQDIVTIVDFQKDLWKYYDSIDIVLVPTTDPEPFGLVAIEGMLSKKPVIASNHGGIIEIVINKETGLLFEPNNQIELKRAIETLINNRDLLISFGEKGEKRAKLKFSLEKYIEDFKVLYLNRSK
jgi:glycosyltransferase involved in cell wall biosynthesis